MSQKNWIFLDCSTRLPKEDNEYWPVVSEQAWKAPNFGQI